MTGVVETLAIVGSAAATAAPYVTAAASVAGAGLQIVNAQRQASVLKHQATQQQFAAQQELLRGREQANQVRRQLQQVRSAQSARYAAAGVLLDDGTPETVAAATEADAERQLTIAGGNAAIAAGARATQAGTLRETASAALTNGWLQAGTGMFDLVDRNLQRVPGTARKGAGAALAGQRAAAAPAAPGAFDADAALGALY